MRISCRGALCFVVLAGILSIPQPVLAASTTYPSPETYLQDGRYSGYQDAVKDFLKANPSAPEAPRVALDLMVAATVLDDPATALRMRRTLLLDYTGSVPGKFVLSQFREASEFTSVMFGVFADSVESPPVGLPAKFDSAMRAGVAKYQGQALLGGQTFIAFTAAMAHQAGDSELQNGAMSILASAGPQGAEGLAVAQTLVDDHTPLPDRLAMLHGLVDRGLAIPFERFLISKMSPAELGQVAVQKAIADDFLFQRRLSDALPILDKLPADSLDGRLTFWHACAIAADGDDARSAKMLGDLASKSPTDPWGQQAAQLQPVIANLDRSLTTDADGLLTIIQKIKHQTGCVELNASYTRGDGTVTDLYVGFIAGDQFHLSVNQGNVIKAACKSSASGSSYFVDADNTIHTYTDPAVLLAPSLQFNGATLSLSNQPDWMHVPDDMVNVLNNLLKLPFISGRDALIEWFRQSIRQGKFPAPVSGTTVKNYAWFTPDPMTPNLSRFEYGFDEATSTLTASSGGFRISSMKFADRAKPLDLKPPAFPDGKVDLGTKIDRNVAASIVRATEIALFGAPVTPSTQPSTMPGTLPSH